VYSRASVRVHSGVSGIRIAAADLFTDFPFALLRPATATVD
jgi:hypothetical protein